MSSTLRPKPTFSEEKKLWRQGYRTIAGVDEVGYGAWAGPVVAGAVVLSPFVRVSGVCDSKQLSARARNVLFPRIIECARAWGVGIVSAEVVDRIGIVAANRRAMRRALAQLSCTPDIVLVDAVSLHWRAPCHSVVDGDGRVLSIAAASIVAKVWRDHLMTCWQSTFPQYGFTAHKGYGTKVHADAIRRHGLSVLHRRSFVPERCLP